LRPVNLEVFGQNETEPFSVAKVVETVKNRSFDHMSQKFKLNFCRLQTWGHVNFPSCFGSSRVAHMHTNALVSRCCAGARAGAWTAPSAQLVHTQKSSARDECFIATMSHGDSTKKRLPNITDDERNLMQKWLQKEHVGHHHLNARWIKGGGGHGGSGMVESKQVKTSGAYEALAKYVNDHLKPPPQPGDDKFWTKHVASTRFTAAFKAYGEACKMGNKGDSAVGASAEEVEKQVNFNAVLLARQVKKCPMYATFHALYAEHPTIHPVMSVGMHDNSANQGDIEAAADGDEEKAETEQKEQPEQPPNSSKGSSIGSPQSKTATTLDKEDKKDKKSFKLKEGAKKVEFTMQWAETMGQAKADRLEFEKMKDARDQENRKRELEERQKDRDESAKRAKGDLLMQLVQRGFNDDQIKFYMRMAGHFNDDAANFH